MGEDLDLSSAPDRDPSTVAPPPTRRSVHGCLGGGQVADVLLWKRRSAGVLLLLASSTVWFLFERAGHSLLSLVSNVLLLLVVILFFWAKSASLLNRPLPPLPNLEVSEDFIGKVADASRDWINCVLAIAHDIALGRDVKLFVEHSIRCNLPVVCCSIINGWWLVNAPMSDNPTYIVSELQAANLTYMFYEWALYRHSPEWMAGMVRYEVVAVLWLVSCIGGMFNFLTLAYVAIVLALTVPALYDKYQDHVDEKLCATHKVLLKGYRKIDETVLRKLPVPLIKEKKTQ